MTIGPLGARDGAFTLGGRRTFLYDGELHYFRVAPALWRPGLERLRAAGMNAVSTYIPWVWHEPEEGRFDFTGVGIRFPVRASAEAVPDTGQPAPGQPAPAP
jgi:beta-galactosidase